MMLTDLLESNTDFFILVYGMSFFVISIGIIAKQSEIAHFNLTDSFTVLAVFGLLHGVSDLMPLVSDILRLSSGLLRELSIAKLVIGIISFQFLAYFALMELADAKNRLQYFFMASPIVIAIHYLIAANITTDVRLAYTVSSYFFAIPSSLLAAASFGRLSARFRQIDMLSLSRDFLVLAAVFLAFAALKTLPVYSSFGEIEVSGVPVLILRSLTAFIGAFFIIRVLSAFKT